MFALADVGSVSVTSWMPIKLELMGGAATILVEVTSHQSPVSPVTSHQIPD